MNVIRADGGLMRAMVYGLLVKFINETKSPSEIQLYKWAVKINLSNQRVVSNHFMSLISRLPKIKSAA